VKGKLVAAGAAGLLLAGCGSGSSGTTGLPKDAVTAGPIVSFCTPGYLTPGARFTSHRTGELAYQLTLRNKSASAVLARYLTVRFLVPGEGWNPGDSVNYNMIFDRNGGPPTGRIAGGKTVSWVFGSLASGIPAGVTQCALETWSSSPTAKEYDSSPWPPR
jgi:hypothetical protein